MLAQPPWLLFFYMVLFFCCYLCLCCSSVLLLFCFLLGINLCVLWLVVASPISAALRRRPHCVAHCVFKPTQGTHTHHLSISLLCISFLVWSFVSSLELIYTCCLVVSSITAQVQRRGHRKKARHHLSWTFFITSSSSPWSFILLLFSSRCDLHLVLILWPLSSNTTHLALFITS